MGRPNGFFDPVWWDTTGPAVGPFDVIGVEAGLANGGVTLLSAAGAVETGAAMVANGEFEAGLTAVGGADARDGNGLLVGCVAPG